MEINNDFYLNPILTYFLPLSILSFLHSFSSSFSFFSSHFFPSSTSIFCILNNKCRGLCILSIPSSIEIQHKLGHGVKYSLPHCLSVILLCSSYNNADKMFFIKHKSDNLSLFPCINDLTKYTKFFMIWSLFMFLLPLIACGHRDCLFIIQIYTKRVGVSVGKYASHIAYFPILP